jgi:4-hydroxybenzoate polyprenyltransferase
MIQGKNSQPLYVDLDGTLIKSDLLLESFLALIKQNLLYVLLIPLWLCQGKAKFKYQIARRVSLRVDLLPYNEEFLSYLKEQKARGRELILISASNNRLVKSVAKHIGIFSQAIGSDTDTNLSGKRKLTCIQSLSDRFTYAGDGKIDLAIWEYAEAAVPVNVSAKTRNTLSTLTSIEREFPRQQKKWTRYLRALRLHQWLKNALVFLPLALAHKIDEPALVIQATLAFICFGLCASSVYVLNDLLDLDSDRQHRSKSKRAFAAGDIPIIHGLIISPLLLASAFLLASTLPREFIAVLALYYLCTGLYSFVLKRIVLVDVIMLASLYTIRIISGAAAISVIPSFWLLSFSMFLFFSLAIVKRYTELDYLRNAGITQSQGRGYYAQDIKMMANFGTVSAFLSVMVFALFINSEETRMQYATPEILWLICPLLLYMVSRIWLLAARGEIEEDPVIFALQDRPSQVLTLLSGMLLWLATIDWLAILRA